ncbi:MAG: hypothetical protein U0746_22695 [Gemmataceae bacterium]
MTASRNSLFSKLFRRPAKTVRHPATNRTRLGLTVLEGRDMPAVTAVLSGGVLTVTGTSGNDVIRVVQSTDTANAGAIRVDGVNITLNGQARASVPDALVNQVVERGGTGNDTLSFVRANSQPGKPVNGNIAARLDGGSGVNSFPGANPQDVIVDPTLTGGRAMAKPIMDKWQAMGAARSVLGMPTADDAATAFGGRVTQFQGGNIYWSANTGAHFLTGSILQKALTTQGSFSTIGLPHTDPYSFAGATVVLFVSPSTSSNIVQRASGQTFLISGKMFDAYDDRLGLPTSDMRIDVAINPHRVTYIQTFDHGTMYQPFGGNVRTLTGAIDSYYRSQGGPSSAIGVPTSDVTTTGNVTWATFQNGAIYKRGVADVSELSGSVWDKYRSYNAFTGLLGLPQGSRSVFAGSNSSALAYRFDNGTIYNISGSSGNRTVAVYGQMRDRYESSALAGPYGPLGLPLSDTTFIVGGLETRFEFGTIRYSPANGWTATYGGRVHYLA